MDKDYNIIRRTDDVEVIDGHYKGKIGVVENIFNNDASIDIKSYKNIIIPLIYLKKIKQK